MPEAIAIEAHGLRRTFGATVAVDGVDLTVPEGVLYGLIGPDGAGKSTLLRMLATVLRPDAGEAAVFGSSVVREPDRVTSQIGYMSQQFCLYPDLTVAENIRFYADIFGVARRERLERTEHLRTNARTIRAFYPLMNGTVSAHKRGRIFGKFRKPILPASRQVMRPPMSRASSG